mmetsp:Transcript_66434/g.130998  ORF Transcript_66434/g.130998 Transcript_66434/m.130998 type:complete len:555 (+) Transcript_66434:51-1715(+)
MEAAGSPLLRDDAGSITPDPGSSKRPSSNSVIDSLVPSRRQTDDSAPRHCLSQSWAPGAPRLEVVPPPWPRSQSFASGEVRNSSRAFGGIERVPRLTLPNTEDWEQFTSFAREYVDIHHQRPHVVAFVNSCSGGQSGRLLKETLAESIGQSEHLALTGEVCDLSLPEEPTRTVEALARGLGRHSQKRLLICGGDGTVTWILTALEQCKALAGKHHLLPAAILPLGTGNDLARSLGWGSKVKAVSDVLKYLQWVVEAKPVTLDQWRVVLRPHMTLPPDHKLRTCGSHPQLVTDDDLSEQLLGDIEESLRGSPTTTSSAMSEEVFVGFWQNYFSFGMDARVANYVDETRSHSACGRCCFRRGLGKVCYAWQGLLHGCASRELTRSVLHMRACWPSENPEDTVASSESMPPQQPLDELLPEDFRQVMFINISCYGGGLNVLPRAAAVRERSTSPTRPDPSPNDGKVEVMGLKGAVSSLAVFARVRKPDFVTSARRVAFRHATGEFMQLDGEPWQLQSGCDVLIQHHRKLTMLQAPANAPFWRDRTLQAFWSLPTSRG